MNAHATAALRTENIVPFPIAPRTTIIELANVTKTFRPHGGSSVAALDDVSLSVGAGEIVGIIGRSGAGKSTLIRIINGLERPTAGRVSVGGTVISELDERRGRAARRSIGMVFQHFNLLSSRTAAGNIALPLEIEGRPQAEIDARVSELIGLVGLDNERDRYPSELSGGQKQRVGIARALATRPKVLLCDEATSALDPETTQQILTLLARIRNELGLTIVLITHEMSVVKAIADRVAVLDGGRIVEQGATFELFARPQHPTTKRFIGSVTNAALPEAVRAALRPEPYPGGKAVLRIVFAGPQADQPVLTRIARIVSTDMNILAGQIEAIGGQPFGTMVVAVSNDVATLGAVQASLARLDLDTELVGYVP